MKITLVPSAMSPGDHIGTRGFFLSSYVIDDLVAIDAGGLGLLGDLDAQTRIQHVFMTHGHMDHIASLPIFLETVFESGDRCVTLHAGAATLESLRKDVFNDRVWPDFIGMAEKGLPFVKVETLEPGRPVDVAGLRLTPVPVEPCRADARVPGPGPRGHGGDPLGHRAYRGVLAYGRLGRGSQGRLPRGIVPERDGMAGGCLEAPDARDVRRRGPQAPPIRPLHRRSHQTSVL